MKILVYGAGVLGCNLARNLLRAGKDVTLLARGNWAAEIKQNGLRIKDKFSLRTSVSRIPVVTELAPDAMYDVIFVVLRYTQLDSVLDTLRANRTKNIVFVGNNVQTKALAAALPEKNVLFAFALSAGHREVDRVVSIDLKKITIGQLPGAISNKQLIGRIFHGTKYKVVYEPNMEDYLLCHAAFVMPAAFACYKTDGDLKKLRGDTAYLNRVLDANIEGYRAIRDAGHTILPKEDANGGGAYFCGFTNSLAILTFDGETSTISGTDKDGNVLFSHTYHYIGMEPVRGLYEFQSDDADSGEFTYFFLAPDTSAETYHIEFRYGSDAEALSQYDTGEYAYWLASGISTDCDQTMIDNCIELFCTENLAG